MTVTTTMQKTSIQPASRQEISRNDKLQAFLNYFSMAKDSHWCIFELITSKTDVSAKWRAYVYLKKVHCAPREYYQIIKATTCSLLMRFLMISALCVSCITSSFVDHRLQAIIITANTIKGFSKVFLLINRIVISGFDWV